MKKQNILYELHESDFISFNRTENELIFRVAINCGVEERLGVECEFAEKFYIYDIVCHEYEMFDTNYDEDQELLGQEILGFQIINGKYNFTILVGVIECVEFTFDCKSIDWIPIEIVTSDELDSME